MTTAEAKGYLVLHINYVRSLSNLFPYLAHVSVALSIYLCEWLSGDGVQNPAGHWGAVLPRPPYLHGVSLRNLDKHNRDIMYPNFASGIPPNQSLFGRFCRMYCFSNRSFSDPQLNHRYGLGEERSLTALFTYFPFPSAYV